MANFGDIQTQLDLTASQSVRRNSADDAFEAFIAAAITHASSHEMGGDDLVDHDNLTNFVEGEHFLQSEIVAVATSVGTGIMGVSAGTLGVLTGSAAVDTVEASLTDDATHIATSAAIYTAIAGAISAEDFWDRVGIVLSPKNSGDTLALDGDFKLYHTADDALGYQMDFYHERITGQTANDSDIIHEISGYFYNDAVTSELIEGTSFKSVVSDNTDGSEEARFEFWSIHTTLVRVMTLSSRFGLSLQYGNLNVEAGRLHVDEIREWDAGVGVTVDTMLLKDYVISCPDGVASNGQPITLKAGDPAGTGNDGGSVTIKAGDALDADSLSTPGGVYLMPGSPYQTSVTAQVFLGDNTYNADVIGIQSNGSQTNVDFALSTKGAGKISLLSAEIDLWNLTVYDQASVMHITAASSYTIDIHAAAGLTDADGKDITLRAGDGNGTGDGGDLFLQLGLGGVSGDPGNIYFGTGAAGILPARIAETNAVFYDTTTGKLSYGAAAGGSSNVSVADQADNRMITCTATADALQAEENMTFDGTSLILADTCDIRFGAATTTIDRLDGAGIHMSMKHWGNVVMVIDSNDTDTNRYFAVMMHSNDVATATMLFEVTDDLTVNMPQVAAGVSATLNITHSDNGTSGSVCLLSLNVAGGATTNLAAYPDAQIGTLAGVAKAGLSLLYAGSDSTGLLMMATGNVPVYLSRNNGAVMLELTSVGIKVTLPETVQNYAVLCDSSGNLTRTQVSGSPTTDFLRGDGSWATPAGSGAGNPAGSDHHVQFNDGGSFGGNANFQFEDNIWVNIGNGVRDTGERLHIRNSTNYTWSQLIMGTTTYAHGLWIKLYGTGGSTYSIACLRDSGGTPAYVLGVTNDGRSFFRGYTGASYTLRVEPQTATGHGLQIDMTQYTSGAYYAIQVQDQADATKFTLTGAGDMYTAGNVGIGAAVSGTYELYIGGDIYASGTIIGNSDIRYKEVLGKVPFRWKDFMDIDPIKFNRKEHPESGPSLGFSAQQMNKHWAEVVSYDSEQDRYGLKYNGIIAINTTAIQRLKTEADILRDRITVLEEEVKILKQAA